MIPSISVILTAATLGLTGASVVFGTLFGLLRGRNRAFLRLILVVLSAVAAYFVKDIIVNALMNLEIEGKSVSEVILGLFNETEIALPEAALNLVLSLIQIIVGLICFLISFLLLFFLTWAIIFPILKIFIKKGIKPGKGLGSLFGLIQGIVFSIVICAPLCGLITQANKITKIEVQGEQVLSLPEEFDLDNYCNSPTAKVFNTAGGWLFELVTTTTDANGKKFSFSNISSALIAIVNVADKTTNLPDIIGSFEDVDSTPQDQKEAITTLGNMFIEMGESLDDLPPESKEIINEVIASVKDFVGDTVGEVPPELESFIENFDAHDLNFASLGNGINSLASCLEKTSDHFDNEEPITQDEVTSIIEGFENNSWILDVLTVNESVPEIITVTGEEAEMFDTAIEAADLTDSEKEILRQLLSLPID